MLAFANSILAMGSGNRSPDIPWLAPRFTTPHLNARMCRASTCTAWKRILSQNARWICRLRWNTSPTTGTHPDCKHVSVTAFYSSRCTFNGSLQIVTAAGMARRVETGRCPCPRVPIHSRSGSPAAASSPVRLSKCDKLSPFPLLSAAAVIAWNIRTNEAGLQNPLPVCRFYF